MGFPTVLIGTLAAARVGDPLTCVGPPEYQAQVLADILTIAMTTNSYGTWSQGRETMDRIDNGTHDVTIRDWDPADPGNQCSTTNDACTPGTGADITIYYDPTYEPPTAADPSVNRPGDVGLHHEMGHAASASEGNWINDPATNPNNPHMEEERNIALDNEYRDARGIPRRADHQHL